jgi:hypothetical protein
MAELLRTWTTGPYVRLTDRELYGHHLRRVDDGATGVHLGELRDGYPGTDSLSQSVNPHAIRWLLTAPPCDWLYAEGNRLGKPSFLLPLAEWTNLVVAHIVINPEIATARREARATKPLSEKFVKTAISTAYSTAKKCREAGIRVVDLDGEKNPLTLAQEVELHFTEDPQGVNTTGGTAWQ